MGDNYQPPTTRGVYSVREPLIKGVGDKMSKIKNTEKKLSGGGGESF